MRPKRWVSLSLLLTPTLWERIEVRALIAHTLMSDEAPQKPKCIQVGRAVEGSVRDTAGEWRGSAYCVRRPKPTYNFVAHFVECPMTLLLQAILDRNRKSVEALVKSGAQLNEQVDQGASVLFAA